MVKKMLYSMGEVSEMFDVRPSLIRYWCDCFASALKPRRNNKGNRMFSPEDVETLKQIYHLVKERGMTLDGARRALNVLRSSETESLRRADLLERLQRVRAMLVQVRETIGAVDEPLPFEGLEEDDGPEMPATVEPKEVAPEPAVKAKRGRPRKKVVDAPVAESPKAVEEERPLPFVEQTLF